MTSEAQPARYAVHWMLSYGDERTAYCAEAIRQNWWKAPVSLGERRMAVDWLAGVVVVMAETPADDIATALATTRDQVLSPLERAALPFPDSLIVMAGPAAPR